MKTKLKSRGFVSGAIVLVYAVSVTWLMALAGEPTDSFWWMSAGAFLIWCVAPILVPLFIRSWVITTGVGAIAFVSCVEYYLAILGPGARSTSGIVFIFLPIYEWIAVVLLIGLNSLVHWVRK